MQRPTARSLVLGVLSLLILSALFACNETPLNAQEPEHGPEQEPEPEERHLFQFAPPSDPFVFERSIKIRRESSVEGRESRVDEVEGEERVRIHSIPTGYHYEVVVESIEFHRNGEPINDPVLQTLSAIGLTYILDESGRFQGIDGIEIAVEVALEKLPEEIRSRLSQLVTPEMILNRERAEWQGRYDDWIDLEVVVGTSWRSDTSFTLPNGSTVDYDVLTSVEAVVDCQEGSKTQCLEISAVYSSDGAELAEMARENLGKVVESFADEIGEDEAASTVPDPGTGSGSITGSYRRIIDPKTMLLYEETMERTIELVLDVGGSSVPSRNVEQRKSTFRYPSLSADDQAVAEPSPPTSHR